MKKWMIAAAFALTACGQASEQAAETKAGDAPASESALDRLARLQRSDMASFAEYIRTSTGPDCIRVYRMEDRGIVPPDVAVEAHKAHIGARAFNVHCGPAGAEATFDGAGQWVIYFPAQSQTPIVAPCRVEGTGEDICWADLAPPPPAAAPQ